MLKSRQTKFRLIVIACGLAALAGCATPPPPPPPAAPPPVQVVIPSRPTPPSGAVSLMAIPAVGANGIRQTVNYNITPAQTVWNLRSAMNVAALSCRDTEHAAILPAYAALLDRNKRKLTAVNKEITKQFKDRYGSEGRNAQDSYMTQVYNYFALPPAHNEFCNVAARVAGELMLVESGDLETFAARGLQAFEVVFEDFYRAFEQYRVNVALWDARYGSPQVVNPASYTGAAYYTPADQGFGPEPRGKPDFISEPVVESTSAQPAAGPVQYPVIEGAPAAEAAPVSAPVAGQAGPKMDD